MPIRGSFPRESGSREIQEDDLMMRIAKGDENSFALLYGLWSRRVMAYAVRSLRDVHEAQDVVQETFIQVYKAAPKYRAEGKFGAFVFRIAGNLVRGRFRGALKADSLSDVLDDETLPYPQSLQYSPEEGVINGIDIDRRLSALPSRQKEALILVASGVSYADGAEMMSITVDAFAQLVLRGRRALKFQMTKDE